jgi:NAD(P)-dependent dehydrogenase (short-subunit alcohol dehydrogenase family)
VSEARVWLISGCSTGIGRAIAEAALAHGDRVAVTARRPADVADLVGAWPEQARAIALDVTDCGAIEAAVREAEAALGPIDVLVNNAGYGYMAAVEEGEDDAVRRMFDTNFFGAVDLVKAVLPGMRARRSGCVINVSSMAGLVANPPNVYYSASKHALESVTEALAKEVAPLGIRVCAVEPGAVRTDWSVRSMQETASPIADYDETVGRRKQLIKLAGDKFPGDPRKVADVVVMLAGLPEPPLRMVLGRDAFQAYEQKLRDGLASLEAWQATSLGIDFDRD